MIADRPQTNREPLWSFASKQIAAGYALLFDRPIPDSPRRHACVFYGTRVSWRNLALDMLIPTGLYPDAYLLVRAAYEDWVSLAFILQDDGPGRAEAFEEDLWKHEARVFDAFAKLCGEEAASRHLANVPAEAKPYVGLPRSKTTPRAGWNWQDMAGAIGLGEVHSYIYTRLSDVCHGNIKGEGLLFDGQTALLPERHLDFEDVLTLWVWWFHLRTLALCGSELGTDLEQISDAFIEHFVATDARDTPACCVLVKERLR